MEIQGKRRRQRERKFPRPIKPLRIMLPVLGILALSGRAHPAAGFLPVSEAELHRPREHPATIRVLIFLHLPVRQSRQRRFRQPRRLHLLRSPRHTSTGHQTPDHPARIRTNRRQNHHSGYGDRRRDRIPPPPVHYFTPGCSHRVGSTCRRRMGLCPGTPRRL